MVKILDEPEEKRVKCIDCKSTIGYFPEDVEHNYDGDGGSRVKCPRPRCSGHGYLGSM